MPVRQYVSDEELRVISECAKTLIYAANQPVSRLARDVLDIGRYEEPGSLMPQLKLVLASPPLVPASAAILDSMVRMWGCHIFEDPYCILFDAVTMAGPIAAAETFILLLGSSDIAIELLAICDVFSSVFDQYPDVFLTQTRELLDIFRRSASH